MKRWVGYVIIFAAGAAVGIVFGIAGTPSPRAELAAEYDDVVALSGAAKGEVLALAKLLRGRPGMAIDFTHLEFPQYCLNTRGHMLHLSANPQARIPLAFLYPAKPLIAAGLDVSKLSVEPESVAELESETWYYYPAGGRIEPLHGKPLGEPMLVWTSGSASKPVTWP